MPCTFTLPSQVSECPSFLGQINIPLYEWATFCLSAHLLTDVDVAMNVGLRRSPGGPGFTAFEYLHRSGNTALYVTARSHFLRNCRTVFQSGYTFLPEIPLLPHSTFSIHSQCDLRTEIIYPPIHEFRSLTY